MTWVCDGCSATFDDPDSPAALAHYAEGTRQPACWGLMEVGGRAHAAFLAGEHPMAAVLGSVEQALMDTGLLPEVLRD